MIKGNVLIHLFLVSIFIIVITKIYSPWFTHGEIIGGDWPYYFPEMLSDSSLISSLWTSAGSGVNNNFSLFLFHNVITTIFFKSLHIPWILVYKVFWFLSFLFLSIASVSYYLKVTYKNISILGYALGIFLYITNTYILMIVGGGQMGIALAYSLAPFVLARFIKLISFFNFKSNNLKLSILAGLALSLQILFDVRIAYITMLGVSLYFLLTCITQPSQKNIFNNLYKILYAFVIPISVTLLLHAFWIIPFYYFHLFSIPSEFTSIGHFDFFSFADFSHSFSLLHPNWPENVFGKTYFLKPEFLILPILAFSSLFFVDTSNKGDDNTKRNVLFGVALGLLGAFFAKGDNPPFQIMNAWVFLYIPGMNLFRDPTKFYLFIALSYSILIPYTIYSIHEWIKSKIKDQKSKIAGKYKIVDLSCLFLIFITLYLILLINPAIFGQLEGTFANSKVPREYQDLKNFIVKQPQFFRTFWIPTQSRFRIQTEQHPLLNGNEFFHTASNAGIIKELRKGSTRDLLSRMSVKYFIVPYDSTREIFLEDRKYNKSKREFVEQEIDKIDWLEKIQDDKLTIYQSSGYHDHLSLIGDGKITYKKKQSTMYSATISSSQGTRLFFGEIYHPLWKAKIDNKTIIDPQKKELGMEFSIPKGEHSIDIYFFPQKIMPYTYAFSAIVLVFLIVFLLVSSSRTMHTMFKLLVRKT